MQPTPIAPFQTLVQFYNWTDQLVPYTYGSLRILIRRLQWSLNVKGADLQAWKTARRLLNCPKHTRQREILAHLEESLQSIEEQILDLQTDLTG